MPRIATTPEVDTLLSNGAVVAIGISGGKDSNAVVFATLAHLDRIGHIGPRVLIHSDLGRLEWRESLPMCRRLAEHVGLDLLVVRRNAGDLLDRWRQRWRNNVARYVALECVKLILPWSTPALRFCTSEMKVAVICRELVQRFPGQAILSVSGIRREESAGRAKALVSKEQPRLTSRTHRTHGLDWHPILDWNIADVLESHEAWEFTPHEAYTVVSRVSCCFCTMASRGDLVASAACPDNQETYRALVQLEIDSTFHFQSGTWLGDVAPDLLTQAQRLALAETKERASRREAAEARIPKRLWYTTKGWPTGMPTREDAALLAEVRREVAAVVGLDIEHATADEVVARYAEILALRAMKDGGRTVRLLQQEPSEQLAMF